MSVVDAWFRNNKEPAVTEKINLFCVTVEIPLNKIDILAQKEIGTLSYDIFKSKKFTKGINSWEQR